VEPDPCVLRYVRNNCFCTCGAAVLNSLFASQGSTNDFECGSGRMAELIGTRRIISINARYRGRYLPVAGDKIAERVIPHTWATNPPALGPNFPERSNGSALRASIV